MTQIIAPTTTTTIEEINKIDSLSSSLKVDFINDFDESFGQNDQLIFDSISFNPSPSPNGSKHFNIRDDDGDDDISVFAFDSPPPPPAPPPQPLPLDIKNNVTKETNHHTHSHNRLSLFLRGFIRPRTNANLKRKRFKNKHLSATTNRVDNYETSFHTNNKLRYSSSVRSRRSVETSMPSTVKTKTAINKKKDYLIRRRSRKNRNSTSTSTSTPQIQLGKNKKKKHSGRTFSLILGYNANNNTINNNNKRHKSMFSPTTLFTNTNNNFVRNSQYSTNQTQLSNTSRNQISKELNWYSIEELDLYYRILGKF
jgi:hypothetical protein